MITPDNEENNSFANPILWCVPNMSLSSTPDMNKPVDGDVEKVAVETAVPVNDVVVASGHVQELERNFVSADRALQQDRESMAK